MKIGLSTQIFLGLMVLATLSHNFSSRSWTGSSRRLALPVGSSSLSQASADDAPITSLPAANASDPVHLFLLGGQSECVGGASSDLLASFDSSLSDVQEGVWFAGIYPRYATDGAFFIAPMKAGQAGNLKFGPEIGFGQRVRNVTGARVLIIKTCIGATSVWKDWNPEAVGNRWDHKADDGTAAWLRANAHASEYTRPSSFKNTVYNARLTTEALAAAGVAYNWKGILWVQGDADKIHDWCRIGKDTARVFDGIREAVGNAYLPIVDTGSNGKHNVRKGKAYAGELVRGGNVTTVEHGGFSSNPDSTCPDDSCPDAYYISNDFFNHYGWDPGLENTLQPAGANDKTFRWFVDYPNNAHSEYEGMIFKGRMLANAYIRKFTTLALPEAMVADDPLQIFPWVACSPGTTPSPEHQCWMEQGTSASDASCIADASEKYGGQNVKDSGTSNCPDSIRLNMIGAENMREFTIISGPGTCTKENRVEFMWRFDLDVEEHIGLIMFYCYCTSGNQMTNAVRPGMIAYIFPAVNRMYKQCSKDQDCYIGKRTNGAWMKGCANRCIAHTNGTNDCRPDYAGGQIGCATDLSDPTYNFNPNILKDCFGVDPYLSCKDPTKEADPGRDVCEGTVTSVPENAIKNNLCKPPATKKKKRKRSRKTPAPRPAINYWRRRRAPVKATKKIAARKPAKRASRKTTARKRPAVRRPASKKMPAARRPASKKRPAARRLKSKKR